MFRENRILWIAGLVPTIAMGVGMLGGCGGGPSYEGPERAAVTGTVTFNGNPIAHGNITFLPVEGGRLAHGLIENGNYSITEEMGPNLGKHRVQIAGHEEAPIQEEEDGVESEDVEEEGEDPGSAAAGKQILPDKFNRRTELDVDIISGANTHNFPLTST